MRVLDFTWALAGPFLTYWFSMAGAEVIKVESRDRPDIFRVLGQRYGWDLGGTVDESPPFTELSAGKKSLTLDLKHPKAVELILRVAASCQVVTEAFRPGVMDRLGLGADALQRANPKLVVISLSGWGPGTVEHAQAGYAPVFAAYSGLSEATGYPDGPPSAIRQPMDVLLGTHGVLATMAGLINARRTGTGAHIGVAGVDAAALSVADLVVAAQLEPGAPSGTRRTNDDPSWACPHDVYRCADGRWLAVAVGNDAEWAGLVAVVGSETLSALPAGDPRARWADRAVIGEAVAAWAARHQAADIERLLVEAGVPAAISRTLDDVAGDYDLWASGFISTVTTPSGRTHELTTVPWRTGMGPRWTAAPPPRVGEHNAAVLQSLLGLDDDEIAALERDGVFG